MFQRGNVRGFWAIFQLFGAAPIQVQLLFEGGGNAYLQKSLSMLMKQHCTALCSKGATIGNVRRFCQM